MCGILGAISKKHTPDLTPALQSLAHRGPDGYGVWKSPSSPFIALGHRRLSIIELSDTGSQPMVGPGRTVLVFNGEIYNYIELKKLLPSSISFAGNSDTEVLLHCLENWGLEKTLTHVRGMFAFVWWDGTVFHGVRDAFGEKPFIYFSHAEHFAFASEIQTLIQLVPRNLRPDVDPYAVYEFLRGGAVPAPLTGLKGVCKLGPGQRLELNPQQLHQPKVITWYRPKIEAQPKKLEPGYLLKSLEESVAIRCRADVPVGVFLSGGWDSSTLAALYRKHTDNFAGFTVALEFSEGSNETPYAQAVAKHLGIPLHIVRLSENEFERRWNHIGDRLDCLISDSVLVPLHAVSELARSHNHKVVLGGEGADEVFWGYQNYTRAAQYQQRLGWAHSYIWNAFDDLFAKAPKYEALGRILKGDLGFLTAAPVLTQNQSIEFLGTTYKPSSESNVRAYLQNFPGADVYQKIQLAELRWRLGELLLMRLDWATMQNSLEVRAPFLSPEIVEMMINAPFDQKFDGKTEKALFKQSVDALLPDAVKRPKVGFCGSAKNMLTQRFLANAKSRLLEELPTDYNKDYIGKHFDTMPLFTQWSLITLGRVLSNWKKFV